MKLPLPIQFGSIIVADHMKFNNRDEAVGGRNYALGIMDRHTGWTDGYPSVGKSTETNTAAFRQFAASSDKIDNCWIDNAPELVSACKALGYRRHLSIENRPQSNGVAERNIRRILEGTRAALHDSGLSQRYWHVAMRCYCALRNFVDIWKLDKTPYELRFNAKFKRQLIPFGSKVYYTSTSKNEDDKRQKLGPRLIPGIFVGYKLYPGGIWRDEYLVLDFDAFQSTRFGLHIADHDIKELYIPGTAPDDTEKHFFHVRIGAISHLPGDDMTVHASPDIEVPWAEDVLSLLDLPDPDPNGTPTLNPPDPALSSVSDQEDYWEVRGLYLYRVHLKPRTTRYSLFELSEMPPWNLENIDIFRTTEPKDGIRDESYWTNHAEDLSVLMYDAQGVPVPWTGTTRFELVLPPDMFKENGRNYMWVRPGRKTQYQKITPRPVVICFRAYRCLCVSLSLVSASCESVCVRAFVCVSVCVCLSKPHMCSQLGGT